MTKQKPAYELKATQERIDEIYNGLSLRLNQALKDKGLNDKSLQTMSDYLGLKIYRFKGIIGNKSDIPFADLISIAEKLETTPDYLLFGIREKKQEKSSATITTKCSIYEAVFISKEKMTDMLINTIFPKLSDEQRNAVMTHARLLANNN